MPCSSSIADMRLVTSAEPLNVCRSVEICYRRNVTERPAGDANRSRRQAEVALPPGPVVSEQMKGTSRDNDNAPRLKGEARHGRRRLLVLRDALRLAHTARRLRFALGDVTLHAEAGAHHHQRSDGHVSRG
jgi:hypothetical protein